MLKWNIKKKKSKREESDQVMAADRLMGTLPPLLSHYRYILVFLELCRSRISI